MLCVTYKGPQPAWDTRDDEEVSGRAQFFEAMFNSFDLCLLNTFFQGGRKILQGVPGYGSEHIG